MKKALLALLLAGAALPALSCPHCYRAPDGRTYCSNQGCYIAMGIRGHSAEAPDSAKSIGTKSVARPAIALDKNNPEPWRQAIAGLKADGNAKDAAALQEQFDKTFPAR